MSMRFRFAAALAFPITCLFILAGWHLWVAIQGQKVTLPIHGFDPRDLLAGHYLVYRIEYGLKSLCSGPKNQVQRKKYVCFAPKKIFYTRPKLSDCQKYLKGICQNGIFQTGIDRFYIPQKHAQILEKAVVNNNGKIVLSLDGYGGATIIDLLIGGRSWTDWVSAND